MERKAGPSPERKDMDRIPVLTVTRNGMASAEAKQLFSFNSDTLWDTILLGQSPNNGIIARRTSPVIEKRELF